MHKFLKYLFMHVYTQCILVLLMIMSCAIPLVQGTEGSPPPAMPTGLGPSSTDNLVRLQQQCGWSLGWRGHPSGGVGSHPCPNVSMVMQQNNASAPRSPPNTAICSGGNCRPGKSGNTLEYFTNFQKCTLHTSSYII